MTTIFNYLTSDAELAITGTILGSLMFVVGFPIAVVSRDHDTTIAGAVLALGGLFMAVSGMLMSFLL